MIRLIAFPLLVLAAIPMSYVAAAAPAAASGPYLVLAPPWRDADALIAAAGGRPAGPAAAPLGRLVWADDPGFPQRAADLGLLVRDGRALSSLCRTAS